MTSGIRKFSLTLTTAAALTIAALWAPNALAASGGAMAVDCDTTAGGIQTSCSYPSGGRFKAQVNVTESPPDGHFGFDAKLKWKGSVLQYLPTKDKDDETLWKGCDIGARSDNQKTKPSDPSVLFACVPGPPSPEQGEEATGAVLRFAFKCEDDGTSPMKLVSRQGDPQLGTHFLSKTGNPVDPKLSGATVRCGSGSSKTESTPATTEKKKSKGGSCAGLEGQKLAECEALAKCKKLGGQKKGDCVEQAKQIALDNAATQAASTTAQGEDSDGGPSTGLIILLVAAGLALAGGAALAIRRRMRQ